MTEHFLHDDHRDDLLAKIVGRVLGWARGQPEWDQPPRLYGLYLRENGAAAVDMSLPDAVWATGNHPAEVLAAMTHVCRQPTEASALLASWLPGGLYGLALQAEGYSLSAPEGATEAEEREAVAWVAQHAIADHPWGSETKFVSAVDLDGCFYYAEHRRGEDAEPVVHVARPGDDDVVGGAMPIALGQLLDALHERLANAPGLN